MVSLPTSSLSRKNMSLDSLFALQNVTIPEDQRYCLLAYFIIDPAKNGNHGMWIFLGAFGTAKKAAERGDEIIRKTDYKCLLVRPSGEWQDLLENPDTSKIKWIPVDKESILREERRKEFKKEQQEIKLRRQREQQLARDKEQELIEGTLEHYTHQWYMAVRTFADISYHEKELKEARELYQERVAAIRKGYASHPEHEDNWLTVLEPKLKERQEEHIFELMQKGHDELLAEILPQVTATGATSFNTTSDTTAKTTATAPDTSNTTALAI